MVGKLKPFQEKTFSAGGTYDAEFTGLPISKIGLRWAATLTGSPATVRTDAAWRLLGTPEINQAENSLIRMAGSSWRLLSAILNGSFDYYAATTATGQGAIVAQALIDLAKIFPNMMINGADKKVSLRGTFGALTDYSGTAPTTVVGTLRAYIESSELDPNRGFLRPRFTESSKILNDADLNEHNFKFESDTVVPFIMLQAFDGSAIDRVDGLVKKISVTHVGEDGPQEIARGTWGQFLNYLQGRASFTPEDYARRNGCIAIPLIDRKNSRYNNAVLFKAGDSLTINYITNGTVEEEFTSVTADGTTDYVRATVVGATPVAGTGDTAATLRAAPAVTTIDQPGLSRADQRRLNRARRNGAQ